MPKNRLANSLAMLMLAAPLIMGWGAAANAMEQAHEAKEQFETRTQFETKTQFETTNRQEDGYAHFPPTMEKDGRRYGLESVKTEIVKEEPIQRDMITLEGEGFTGEPESHRPPETLERDGKVYRLKEASLLDITLEERSKDISAVIPYKGVEYIDTLPDTGDLEVMDEDTGQRMDARLPYKSHKELRSYWDNGFSFPITVIAYDAETYRLGDVEIPKDADLILYGREFLRYLGLPEDYYRILDIQWKGGIYDSHGERRRDALATGVKLLKEIEVTYAGAVTFGGIQAKAYNSVYEALEEGKSGDTIYTINAAATYGLLESGKTEKKSLRERVGQWIVSNLVLVTVCLGIIFVVIGVIFLFRMIAKKGKQQRKITKSFKQGNNGDEEWENDNG